MSNLENHDKERRSIKYPENVSQEESAKELLAYIYQELGAQGYKIEKEKRVDVYFPRIDVVSLLPSPQRVLRETIFEYFRKVVCFEVHRSTLHEITLAKWMIETYGLFIKIATDLNLHYEDFAAYSLLSHVPKGI